MCKISVNSSYHIFENNTYWFVKIDLILFSSRFRLSSEQRDRREGSVCWREQHAVKISDMTFALWKRPFCLFFPVILHPFFLSGMVFEERELEQLEVKTVFDFRSARKAEGEKLRKTKLLNEILVVVASYFLLSVGVW